MKNPVLSIWLVATGCEAKLLIIGISVTIGKEQGLELWIEIPIRLNFSDDNESHKMVPPP